MSLVVNNISVNLGKRQILKDVQFALATGESLAIIGPNGAGKSTLLNAISGMLQPERGNIKFENNLISSLSTGERARKIAVLSQQHQLNFPFRVRDVIQLGRFPHITTKHSDNVVINELIGILQLHKLENKPYTQLSGGEKQRVQVARVLAQIWHVEETTSSLLLMDEPFNSLDLNFQQLALNIFARLKGVNTNVVCVVHDINIALRNFPKILALKDGQQIFFKAPGCLTQDELQKTFSTSFDIIHHPKDGMPLVIL